MLLWWAELNKTLIHLSADGWVWVPSLLVVWPKATQYWSLQVFGEAKGGLWEGSRQAVLPRTYGPVSLSPQWAAATPRLCRRPSTTSRLVWFSLLWGLCSFPLGPDVHATLCVHSKSGVSVSPSPVEVLQSNPLAFKVWFSGNSSFHCQTPRLGSLTWGSEPSLQWVDFCGIIVLQFVSQPPSGYGIWFYCECAPLTVSLWLLLCLCMWGIFFGKFQCLPVDDCSAISCDSGALASELSLTPVLRSERISFYSAILNQSPIFMFFNLSLFHCSFWLLFHA